MKKLIYIVLIVTLLTLIGMYVKDKRNETIAPDIITVVEEENFNYDIVDPITGEVIGSSEGNIIATTTYDDNDDNADGMIIGGVNSEDDFIEENPELTQYDDETIVAE